MNRQIVLTLALALLASSPAQAEDLQISDFVYAGAFRLPDGFDWGARGATFRPSGDEGQPPQRRQQQPQCGGAVAHGRT